MNGTTTFQDSQSALSYLQSKYGSANYKSWQSLRKEWWSYNNYPTAGIPVINFFGDSIGQNGITRQLTNMPKSGSFGQNHFLLKAIRCSYFIANNLEDNPTFAADADVLYSDKINGIFQAGVLEVLIGDRIFVQLPKPFLYAPPADGAPEHYGAGLREITAGTPPAITSETTTVPHAELAGYRDTAYMVDPNILIEAEQHFEVRLKYDSGALATIATGVVDDTDNPLYVGVVFDGIVFRPVQ